MVCEVPTRVVTYHFDALEGTIDGEALEVKGALFNGEQSGRAGRDGGQGGADGRENGVSGGGGVVAVDAGVGEVWLAGGKCKSVVRKGGQG